MKKSFVENLEKNHLFSDEFRTARSIVVVLTTKSHSIGEAPDDKHNSKSIALYISKGFEKVWNKYLRHNLSSNGITGSIFSIIKSFLTGRSLRVVNNDQSSGPLLVNAGVLQGTNSLF